MTLKTRANKLPIADCRLPIESGIKRGRRKIGNESAFTLAEVLAAMLFLAIVVPAAVIVALSRRRPASIFLSRAASVKFAEVTKTQRSSATMHFA